MANITVSGRNEEAFSAVLEAFQSAIDGAVTVPMSTWSVEPEDSEKTVQIGAKVHVPQGKRISVRDKAADYLNIERLGSLKSTDKIDQFQVGNFQEFYQPELSF